MCVVQIMLRHYSCLNAYERPPVSTVTIKMIGTLDIYLIEPFYKLS